MVSEPSEFPGWFNGLGQNITRFADAILCSWRKWP